MEPCKCRRCGHKFYSRKMMEQGIKPKYCPNCKSPLWDTPREGDE